MSGNITTHLLGGFTMKYAAFIGAAVAVLCLSACGGGGSGNGGMTMRPQDTSQPPSSEIHNTQTAFGEPGTRPPLNPLQSSSQIRGRLQQSRPAFGSVAMNLYSPGLSPVRSAETTFTGDRFTLSVQRQNGTGFTLDTARHYAETIDDSTVSTNLVTNRPFATGYIASVGGTKATIAGGSVEWSNTNPTDYLAGGYWLHMDAATPSIEMGAFIDGTDYALQAFRDLPVTGTATYRGRAGGLYVAAGGIDSLSPGAIEIGEYTGHTQLTANFGTMQIHGRVSNVYTFTQAGQHANGVPYQSIAPEPSDISMVFLPAPINRNGTFGADNVTFTSPTIRFTSSTGSWAGQFSNVDNAAGNPRAAAGTNTGFAETAGGSRFVLTGAFYGATDRFQ